MKFDWSQYNKLFPSNSESRLIKPHGPTLNGAPLFPPEPIDDDVNATEYKEFMEEASKSWWEKPGKAYSRRKDK